MILSIMESQIPGSFYTSVLVGLLFIYFGIYLLVDISNVFSWIVGRCSKKIFNICIHNDCFFLFQHRAVSINNASLHNINYYNLQKL